MAFPRRIRNNGSVITSQPTKQVVSLLELLKDVTRFGCLKDWPGGSRSTEDFIFLLRGVHHLRNGALWAGIHDLQCISRWHETATRLLATYVAGAVLLNTAAEIYHNAFDRDKRLLLILGAVLGPLALSLQDYFFRAPRFITRVELNDKVTLTDMARLKDGMRVRLSRETGTSDAENRIAVLAPWRKRLGYVNASLAAALTARCATGEVFAARIPTVLGTAYDLNKRLHVEIYRDAFQGGTCFRSGTGLGFPKLIDGLKKTQT